MNERLPCHECGAELDAADARTWRVTVLWPNGWQTLLDVARCRDEEGCRARIAAQGGLARVMVGVRPTGEARHACPLCHQSGQVSRGRAESFANGLPWDTYHDAEEAPAHANARWFDPVTCPNCDGAGIVKRPRPVAPVRLTEEQRMAAGALVVRGLGEASGV